jgi:hypothetical protein
MKEKPMKEFDRKDAPEVSGGEVLGTPPLLDVTYPMIKLPIQEQPMDTRIAPDQPLR